MVVGGPATIVDPLTTLRATLLAPSTLWFQKEAVLMLLHQPLALIKEAMDSLALFSLKLRALPKPNFLQCQQGRIFQILPSSASLLMVELLASTAATAIVLSLALASTPPWGTKGPTGFLTREHQLCWEKDMAGRKAGKAPTERHPLPTHHLNPTDNHCPYHFC